MGSNRTMSFQRPRLVIYWCCSVLFEWCFLVLRTKQRQMGVQGTYLRPQTKFEKITDRRFRPEFPAVSSNHRPRFPPLGYFPENGAGELSFLGRSGSFSSSIHLWINSGWLGWSTKNRALVPSTSHSVYLGLVLVTMAWTHNPPVMSYKCFY